MTGPDDREAGPPFRRHRAYYLFVKIVVLLCAAYFALRVLGCL